MYLANVLNELQNIFYDDCCRIISSYLFKISNLSKCLDSLNTMMIYDDWRYKSRYDLIMPGVIVYSKNV